MSNIQDLVAGAIKKIEEHQFNKWACITVPPGTPDEVLRVLPLPSGYKWYEADGLVTFKIVGGRRGERVAYLLCQ